MSGKVWLAPHPAKNKDGGPLFPELRSIIADGYGLVGYTGDPPRRPIQLINFYAAPEKWVIDQACELVKQEFGAEPSEVTSVPEPIQTEAPDEDDD